MAEVAAAAHLHTGCRAIRSCAESANSYPEVVEILGFELKGSDDFVVVGAVDLAPVLAH